MPEIKHIGGGVYVVDGKIIRVMEGALDPSTEGGRAVLSRHAARMGSNHVWPAEYGDLTYGLIYPKKYSPDGTKYMVESGHMAELPDDVKTLLRKEFPDRADKI